MSTSAGIGLLLAASLLTTTLSTTPTLAQSSGQTIKERVDTSAAKQQNGSSGATKDAAKPAGPVTMDTYPRTKADRLADEQDKILDRKIKGICRGC
jgi:Rieske Fe-S protein